MEPEKRSQKKGFLEKKAEETQKVDRNRDLNELGYEDRKTSSEYSRDSFDYWHHLWRL